MGQRNLMTGLVMEQHSQGMVQPEPCIALDRLTSFQHPDFPPLITPIVTLPNLEAHSMQEPYGNSMFYAVPHHPVVLGSSLGPGTPNFSIPNAGFHAPLGHFSSSGSHGAAEHERNAHFMDHGYKGKSAVGIPGNSQYLSTVAAPLNTLETSPFSFPQFGGPGANPQLLGQRSVRSIPGVATMDPVLSHGHDNNFIQGNYAAPPFPPPGSIWYDQHCNGRSDVLPSIWSHTSSVPYIHGNLVSGSMDSGNICFPRYHETSRHHYFSHHSVPPIVQGVSGQTATIYPQSTTHGISEMGGPVQSSGLRLNQHYRNDFVPAAPLRHRGLPRLGVMPSDEIGDFYDTGSYVDHHQDMRLDIENMSYEELLALSERIGTVNTGLSQEDVNVHLKTSTRIKQSTDLDTDSCTICQENYKNQDKIAKLDCEHEYHTECLMKWLVIKNICPICKSEALIMEKKKVRVSTEKEVTTNQT